VGILGAELNMGQASFCEINGREVEILLILAIIRLLGSESELHAYESLEALPMIQFAIPRRRLLDHLHQLVVVFVLQIIDELLLLFSFLAESVGQLLDRYLGVVSCSQSRCSPGYLVDYDVVGANGGRVDVKTHGLAVHEFADELFTDEEGVEVVV